METIKNVSKLAARKENSDGVPLQYESTVGLIATPQNLVLEYFPCYVSLQTTGRTFPQIIPTRLALINFPFSKTINIHTVSPSVRGGLWVPLKKKKYQSSQNPNI